jgi:hypothetical protein
VLFGFGSWMPLESNNPLLTQTSQFYDMPAVYGWYRVK